MDTDSLCMGFYGNIPTSNARKGTIEKKASIFATTKEAEDYSS